MLIAIDVPDKEQDLQEKEAAVLQRQQDVEVARATAENARAAVEVYNEVIGLRKAEKGQAEATRDYRLGRYNRFVKLGKGGGIQDGIIEEEERDYRAAEFGLKAAEVQVRLRQEHRLTRAGNFLHLRFGTAEVRQTIDQFRQGCKTHLRPSLAIQAGMLAPAPVRSPSTEPLHPP